MSSAVVWEAFHNESGQRYYYNPATTESSWTLPPGAIFVDKEKEAGKDITANPLFTVATTNAKTVAPATNFNVQTVNNTTRNSTKATTANKSSVWNTKRNLMIFGGIALLVIIAIAVAVAVVLTGKKSSGPSQMGSAALDEYTAANYEANTKQLSLNSAAMMNSDASAILSTIFPSLGGAVNFTNSIPVLSGSASIDVTTLISIGQSLGIDVTPITNLLKNAVASRVFTGTLNRSDKLERPNGVFTADTNCVIALFYKLNEQKFTPETIQFAVQCGLNSEWKPENNLPKFYSFESFQAAAAPVTAPSWLSEWNIVGNASLVISSLDYEYIEKVAESNAVLTGDISRLPRFLSKGINVFAVANARDGKSSLFNGLDGILTKPLASTPYVNLQFSLPLDITFAVDESTGQLNPAVKFGFLSSDRPVKGLIQAEGISLNFKENTGVVGSAVTFYIEGFSSAIADVHFETNINLVMYGGSAFSTWVVGGWSRDSGIIILDGVVNGNWSPFAGSANIPANDVRQVSILSNAKLQLNLTYIPNTPLALNSVRFNATASFKYLTRSPLNPITIFAEGLFTKDNFFFAIPRIPVNNIASLITSMLADSNCTLAARANIDNAMNYLSTNIPYVFTQGSVTFAISTFPRFYNRYLGAVINPGVSFGINNLVINTKAFEGALHEYIHRIDPDYSAIFDVQLNVPIIFAPGSGFQSTTNPTTFTFVVGDLKIEDFTLTNFFIDLEISTIDPSKYTISSEATVELNLPVLSPAPLVFVAGVEYTTDPVKKFKFYGNVDGAIQPKFAPWLKVTEPTLSLTVFPDGNNNAKNPKFKRYSLDIAANVQFLFVPDTKPIACKLTVIDDVFVFSAKSVSMANIYPALSKYVGVPLTQQAIDIVISNANGTDPVTITKINNALGLPGTDFDASSITSLSPLVANLPQTFSLAKPGLNLFAHNLPLADSTGALSLLKTSLANVNVNFTAYFPFSINDQWSVALETSAPISVTQIFTLNHAYFSFDILPSPLRISSAIGALMTMNIPFNPPLTLQVDGAYSTLNNNLTFSGVLSEWEKPFGLPFLTIGETKVKFASYKKNGVATNTGSLWTSAKFREGPSVGLCGALIGGDAALSVSNLGVQTITDSVCQVLGICGGLPTAILNLLGLNQLQFGINLASANIVPSSVNNTDIYCSIPANVRKGVSITTNIDVKGAFMEKVKAIFPDFEKIAAAFAWQFVINLPFVAPSTQSSLHAIRSSYDQKIRLQALNPSHPALQILSKKELSDRAKFLQGLAGASALVFAYENKQINLKITEWFTLQGMGIQADATALSFGLWSQATVQLKGNDDPLLFVVSGAFNGAQVTLSGQLSIANGGWVNPFGLKGLTIYNAGMSVSLGPPAGISGFGLNFKLRFGPKIVVAFAGSVSTASIDSYLSGSIYADGPESAVSPITLGDLFLVVEQMTGKNLNLPPLPGADILSLTKASFSLATASGVDPNGDRYEPGFRFTCIATLFGMEINTDVGTVHRTVNGIPMIDFILSLVLQFSKFNQKIIEWVDKIIPFDVTDWLKNGKSLCDVACVKKISITGFSVVDIITAQQFPKLSLTVAFFGNEKSFDIELKFDKMKSAFSVILDSIKSAFSWDFCVIDANCKGGQVCSHTTWKCAAECPNGQVKVPALGCFPKLSIPGLFDADVNYVAPADWYVQAGVDPYGDPQVFQEAWIAWVQAHATQSTTQAP